MGEFEMKIEMNLKESKEKKYIGGFGERKGKRETSS